MDSKTIKPYAELPYPWTIAREEVPNASKGLQMRWYGLNCATGQETERFENYGAALREVERREVLARGEQIKKVTQRVT